MDEELAIWKGGHGTLIQTAHRIWIGARYSRPCRGVVHYPSRRDLRLRKGRSVDAERVKNVISRTACANGRKTSDRPEPADGARSNGRSVACTFGASRWREDTEEGDFSDSLLGDYSNRRKPLLGNSNCPEERLSGLRSSSSRWSVTASLLWACDDAMERGASPRGYRGTAG